MPDSAAARAGMPGTATVAPTRSLVVAVLTYRREQLIANLVPILLNQVASVPIKASVLVVDNDPSGSAESVVSEWSQGHAVRYVHEPRPGIAAARNRAIAEASAADLLVFIDDDERPRDGWLARMLETMEREQSAAVAGPVISEFEAAPDAWVRAGRFFERERQPTGSRVRLAATNNLLLDLGMLRRHGLLFDERFGMTGGSDTLLTRQLVRAGGEIAWCDEAEVIDIVPANRATRRWVLQRAYRLGNSWVRSELALDDRAAWRLAVRLRFARYALARLIGGSAKVTLGALGGRMGLRARGVRTIVRGAGIIVGVLGGVYAEYRRS